MSHEEACSRGVGDRAGFVGLPCRRLIRNPSAARSWVALTGAPSLGPDASDLWFVFVAPLVTFASCIAAYARPRSWLDDVLVGAMLSSQNLVMYCAMMDASSI